MKVGLVQLCSSDRPDENLAATRTLVREAAAKGASFILTPEVTNCVSSDRAHQEAVLRTEEADETLAGLVAEARALGVWLLIGSLALRTRDADGRFANRSFLVGPDGAIVARYDKIHMFDVNVSETEQYRESAGYRPGTRAVMTTTPFAKIGMTVCYDLRFPALYRRLAQAGAEILTVPAAFNDTTGAAHWESLLRARAIENGAFVLAPAQSGSHAAHNGRPRRTWGHSMVVAPWGEVLADGGTDVGVTLADIDLAAVARARHRVPSLTHDRAFEGP
ncbi:carbon-nitrogen hydrolase family protein [Albidovulum sediminicola]|uniref:Carbon-nitrogen hydrolase family protein n=1 Tax=Albidovulum sediminicola TaxID=2984331 RepID=A0ABT2YWT9_9RHOB|nr:carbon-nitrogen hydrolase family protein [Defluviimonas sp. WL0075]MCV2863227.1 carbon-nitrogen hydrolase family protein [Defluviimonas sp. WL0075]